MNYLLLTLGHSSSAIFVENSGKIQNVIGYEQERLSGIKSDSQFPIDAINEIERNVGADKMKGCTICISHWFNSIQDEENTICVNKYISENDIKKLKSYEPTSILSTTKEFTHHDAHAYSAYAFYDFVKMPSAYKPLYCIVADGFGTNEEVLSIYCRRGSNAPELIHRAYGYENSLGLLYQYATSFVGMKENQDEYKFLGYEALVGDYLDRSRIDMIYAKAERLADEMFTNIMSHTSERELSSSVDAPINFESLNDLKSLWYSYFECMLKSVSIPKDCDLTRIAIALYVQHTIELVVNKLIKEFDIENVCVAGGCFYNVKLNHSILNSINGEFCAMPLAGDQGAAIGMYQKIRKTTNDIRFNFGSLCWGKRRLYNIEKLLEKEISDGIAFIYNENEINYEVIHKIALLIADGHIVNVVRRNMEFGPRALCSTSTLMLPSKANVAANNKMNQRNEVMPCAPVCTVSNASELFFKTDIDRVIGSNDYMICTLQYRKPYSDFYGGVMHNIPLSESYTGRPQIIHDDDMFMKRLLDRVEHLCDVKCLVNTSFNVHGNPIVFDSADIVRNFRFQCEHAESYYKRPFLFILK